jgi:glycosyltransferase involved in cell wall biosynthesis
VSGPRVSVLLPARDAAATLEAALRSVARQSEPRFECVVADDGSRDAGAGIACAFARRDPRFRVLRLARRGLVPALSDGLAACRAPFVARMDADDVMHRERLRLQLEALEARPALAAVGAHVRLFPRKDLTDGMRRYERWLRSIASPEAVRAEAFVECPIPHPTLCARAEVLHAFGFRDAGWPEDYDLVLRLLAAGHALAVVPRRLLLWRDHPERLSRRSPRYAPAAFTACKAAFLAQGFLEAAPDYVLWGYGGTGRALRRALAVHGKRPSHVVELHPRRLGQRIHDAPVIPPDALAALRPARIVVSVAGEGPRARIRAALAVMEFREGRDFLCAA